MNFVLESMVVVRCTLRKILKSADCAERVGKRHHRAAVKNCARSAQVGANHSSWRRLDPCLPRAGEFPSARATASLS